MSIPTLTPLDSPIFNEDVIAEMEERVNDDVICEKTRRCGAPADSRMVIECGCPLVANLCEKHVIETSMWIDAHPRAWCSSCRRDHLTYRVVSL